MELGLDPEERTWIRDKKGFPGPGNGTNKGKTMNKQHGKNKKEVGLAGVEVHLGRSDIHI